ncbi:hypothetical protein REC12_24340 [Desulfosporosinus sp. PR]|uniref:hypothetical protein n=1 Tax=Candidatus Desulfosporosinus nitrosoreducens TaxID=3401928 RepID=UPI0027FA20B5|nr:hypothetical protein [Desulfosporosinus sp. PR]MDQ7096726.1 hypothetical protein [Desulfosporosinus sp. PR]
MDNNEFQEFIAGQFAKLFSEVQAFKQDVKSEFSKVDSRLMSVESKLTSVESKLTTVESRLTSVESKLTSAESWLTSVEQSQVQLETNLTEKIDVLFYDARESQKQTNAEVIDEIRKLGTKVEALQMESSLHEREIKALKKVSP